MSATRDGLEEIYNNLKIELIAVEDLVKNCKREEGFSEFDLRRLYGSLENAVEVYGETLGYITYDE